MITITIERKHVLLISAVVIIAAMLIPAGAWASHQFTDVPNSDWAHDEIGWIADAGITVGCDTGYYCPDRFVTRREMAAFLERLGTNQVVDAKEVGGGTGWMFAQEASPALDVWQTATSALRYNSKDASVRYRRTAVGTYHVEFLGWSDIGTAQVTAYSFANTMCSTVGWISNRVGIQCFNAAGTKVDSNFGVLVMGE